MSTLTIFFWINIILVVLLCLFCFKVYFKNYLDSHNNLIIFLLISSTVVSVFCCVDGLLSSECYKDTIIFNQDFYGKYASNADFIQNLINQSVTHVKKVTLTAYLSFIISIICRKIISNQSKKMLLSSKHKSWDLKRINKKLNSH